MRDDAGPPRTDSATTEPWRHSGRPDAAFDRVARLVCRTLRVPAASLNLVDEDRLVLRGQNGLGGPWASRPGAPVTLPLCRLVVETAATLAVDDARDHPAFGSSAAVAEHGVRAYLGVPLTDGEGVVLGTLCAFDHAPRGWSDDDRSALADLAAVAETEVGFRSRGARHLLDERDLRLLGSVVEGANDAVVITEAEPLDEPGPRIVYVNRAFTRATGYEPHEVIGRSPRILQGPNPDRTALRRLRDGLLAGRPVRAEVVNYRKDGSEYWVEMNLHPVADASGRATHWVAVQRDISERKEAEARLRESERKFHAVFDGTFQFIGLLAPDGTLLEANRTSLEFAGVTRDEVVGLPFAETPWWSGSGEARAQLEAALAAAARGEFSRFEAEHPAADGSVITVDFSLTPVCDESGEVVLLIPEGRDISERKRAEVVLRSREELLRLATRAAGIGIWDWDLAADRLTLSGEARRLAGFEPVGTDGTSEDFAALLHPDDREAVRAGIARARAGRTEFRDDFRVVRRGGSVRWVAARGRFLYDESSGEAARMVGVFTDVTERRERERRSQERAQALAEADRRKDEFLAVLAHELRNPIAPIAHAVKVLQLRDGEPALRVRMRELIGRQVRGLSRLVDDLLDVSRITRGKIRLRLEPVTLQEIVHRAVMTTRPLTRQRDHLIEVQTPPEPLRTPGDPFRLEQVLVNLITNSAKYTDMGGRIRVVVEAGAEGQDVVVRVIDNGKGIAPDVIPRVFDLFTQAEHTLEHAQGGLGIGLTLVRSLVQMHGGSVEARSDGPGRGSEFVVRLPPLATAEGRVGAAPPRDEPPPEPEPPAPAEAPDAPPDRLRVLVVDDNFQAASSLSLILGLWGHDPVVCLDGRAALAAIEAATPDVVLLDIGLPGLDGYQVASRLDERPDRAGMVLIAITGYGRDEDRERAMASGFDHYFVKPVDLDALERLIDEASRRPGRDRAMTAGAARRA